MKINHIINETTTAGAVATVAMPLGEVEKRIPTKSKAKKKGPYQNSLNEGKMKDLAYDLQNMKPIEFQRKYGKKREEMLRAFQVPSQQKQMPVQQRPMSEAELQEDDLIIVPAHAKRLKSGFIPHDKDRTDHEVEMALSDLYQAAKNAKKTYMMLKDRTEDDGIEGWVQEKIIKANDYLNAIREYYEHKQMQEGLAGALAGGVAGAALMKSPAGASIGAQLGSELQDKLANEAEHGGGVIAGGISAESIEKKNPWKNADPRVEKPVIPGTTNVAKSGYYPTKKPPDIKKKPATPFGPTTKDKVDEKAVSKAQQRFMGMVHAVQKGEMKAPSKAVASAAKGMSKKAGHEYAATKHKGLPEKVKKKD